MARGARAILSVLVAVMLSLTVVSAPLVPSRPAYAEQDVTITIDKSEGTLTATAVLAFTTAGVPFITSDDSKGLPVIGVPLHANAGSWVPEPTSFSYQWYSFDEPITGATEAAYTPTIEDYCNEISVKITAHLNGYTDTTAQSDFVQPEPAETEGNGNDTEGNGDNTGNDDGDGTDDGGREHSEFRATILPWAPRAATGNYISDNYSEVPATHVFESVTQERLLDILSSTGTYYIVFGGPSRASSQSALPLIQQQAQSAGITRIYHFDPLIDGYQADISRPSSPYRTTESISALWSRITSLLPTGEPLASFDITDTLLIRYEANAQNLGTRGTIPAFYRLTQTQAQAHSFAATVERAAIDQVFRSGGASGTVVPASVRTDLQFFNRVYNASATLVNSRMPEADYKVDAASITLFDGLTDQNFKLHQIGFAELQNLYQTPGEHIILFGASWCHNTQAIIGTVAAQAAKNPDIQTVYVYDTTLGSQVSFGTGTSINRATAYSSVFNSRNSAGFGPAGNYNISYMYGEAVRPLGSFLSENNTNKTGSIEFYANGDLSGNAPVSSVAPWDAAASTPLASVNAIRLQLPFLVAYDKDAASANKAVRQWLHAQASTANLGRYLEYMLELAWVRAGQSTSAADAAAKGVSAAYESKRVFKNGGITNDEGLTIAQAGARATVQINHVLQITDEQGGLRDPGGEQLGLDDEKPDQEPAAAPAASTDAEQTVDTTIVYRPGTGTAATNGGGSGTSAVSLVQESASAGQNNRVSSGQTSQEILEAATPLSEGSDAQDSGRTDFRLPLAVAVLLAALAIFAAIGIKTGFIAAPPTTAVTAELSARSPEETHA
ncbi:MAG: hypothetical protein LBJ48_02915 [Coriobacteriales bacterium]|jgi:hypothetical protein|nr:hypothetical protein [Coriobacteriales bacterium]